MCAWKLATVLFWSHYKEHIWHSFETGEDSERDQGETGDWTAWFRENKMLGAAKMEANFLCESSI